MLHPKFLDKINENGWIAVSHHPERTKKILSTTSQNNIYHFIFSLYKKKIKVKLYIFYE